MPYSTNAELSVLASSFIDDNESNLLFRMYVPTGRLYATEADKLLSLFHKWLGESGRHAVRQDGYSTAAGHVYEFFGDGTLSPEKLSQQFDDFSGFLEKCVEDPSAAASMLVSAGIEPVQSAQMIARYAKEARRLSLDIAQSREARLIALKHQLQSELLDSGPVAGADQIQAILEHAIPSPGAYSPGALLASPETIAPGPQVMINVNQQFIEHVQGSVFHNVQGSVHLGPEAKDLLALIERFGGGNRVKLESAVHELEDSSARPEMRLRARQRIKGFLLRHTPEIGAFARDLALKYLESKITN
jgi:hypothetical protein